LHWSQLNILCSSLVKPYYAKNDNSPVIHRSHVTTISRVLQRIGFHRSGVIHKNVQYFIWSKNGVFNCTADTYSLHKCSETILCLRTRVTCFLCTEVHGSKKNLSPISSDLNLVNSLLWRALRSKLCREDVRDVDYLKCVLLHCWV